MLSESTSRPVSVAGVRAIIRPRSPPSGPNDSTWRRWRLGGEEQVLLAADG